MIDVIHFVMENTCLFVIYYNIDVTACVSLPQGYSELACSCLLQQLTVMKYFTPFFVQLYLVY